MWRTEYLTLLALELHPFSHPNCIQLTALFRPFFDDLVVMNVMVTVVSDWYYVVGRQEKPAASIFRVEAILVL